MHSGFYIWALELTFRQTIKIPWGGLTQGGDNKIIYLTKAIFWSNCMSSLG